MLKTSDGVGRWPGVGSVGVVVRVAGKGAVAIYSNMAAPK